MKEDWKKKQQAVFATPVLASTVVAALWEELTTTASTNASAAEKEINVSLGLLAQQAQIPTK